MCYTQCFYTSEIVLICALFAAKYSIFLLVRRLFAVSLTKGMAVMWIIPSIGGILGLASILVVAIPCWPMQVYKGEEAQCPQHVSARHTRAGHG